MGSLPNQLPWTDVLCSQPPNLTRMTLAAFRDGFEETENDF